MGYHKKGQDSDPKKRLHKNSQRIFEGQKGG